MTMQPADLEAVRSAVLAEREARDLGDFETMAAAFAPASSVRVSWFQGNGHDFVEASRAIAAIAGGPTSFHEIGAVRVDVRDDRATASAGCAVHVRGLFGQVEVDVISRGRFYWRLERVARWLISAIDMLYTSDTIAPVFPGQSLADELATSEMLDRPYRFLALFLERAGAEVDPDLPGIDRPEVVAALMAGQRRWLEPSTDGTR